eukprot:2993285-Rhodomonas_salina.1
MPGTDLYSPRLALQWCAIPDADIPYKRVVWCYQVIKQMAEYMLAQLRYCLLYRRSPSGTNATVWCYQRIKPPADAKGPKQEQYVSLLL